MSKTILDCHNIHGFDDEKRGIICSECGYGTPRENRWLTMMTDNYFYLMLLGVALFLLGICDANGKLNF